MQTGRVLLALCAEAFEPQARRYNRNPNSAWAKDSFSEFILGWTTGLANRWKRVILAAIGSVKLFQIQSE